MSAEFSFEKMCSRIASMSKLEVIDRLVHFDGPMNLDFTNEYLETLSTAISSWLPSQLSGENKPPETPFGRNKKGRYRKNTGLLRRIRIFNISNLSNNPPQRPKKQLSIRRKRALYYDFIIPPFCLDAKKKIKLFKNFVNPINKTT